MTAEASKKIDKYIYQHADWRGQVILKIRKYVQSAAPKINEEWKWNCPGWSQNGNVISVCAFKKHVKVNFFKGASLPDPNGLFNAGLDSKASRAIDIGVEDTLDAKAFKKLVQEAVALNSAR